MAGRRLAFYSPSTPVSGRDGPVSGSPQTDKKKLLSALSELSRQIAELTTFITDRFNSMDDRFNTVEDRLTALEGLACKTYYKTLRRSYRYQQPDLSLQAEAMKKSARSHSRRKRLFDARRGVLAMDEMDVWQCATVDLMSDEEDGVVDGVSGWIVKPPPSRNPELSELCATLQSRLEADPKYRATHHRRLHVSPMPPAPHSTETASMHFTKL
ncbi:uncharacterized protein C14orf93-like [Neoarius graeffei]|uniref:uncharacterized protein C14orf93-like n=1 Tax=Neoarius graeffei TaxID=443677 RepID=UPI00298D0D51|nr:uncharacterized protein C14orf93-like [Neoarius graeffei]